MTRRKMTFLAVGCHDKRDKNRLRPQIVIRFDRDTFDDVRRRAKQNGISFTKSAIELIEIGLETERLDRE